MARAGMSNEEMNTFLKETFCVDSTFTAAALFNAAELRRQGWHDARARGSSSGQHDCPVNLPTYPPCRPDGRRPHLPTYPPRLFAKWAYLL